MGSAGFRADIQALRAIALLLVLAFHVWPARLPGGYVGVDVFFVISGYLITGHLLREVASTGSVHLPTFYARRACRLLPAASLTLVAVCAAAYLWTPASTWTSTAADMAASSLYAQNWVLVRRSVDYLAQDEPPSPLQHFWSLAVEEQFYLGWPLVVGGVAAWWRRRRSGDGIPALPGLPPLPPPRRAYALPMGALCALSFGAALYYARVDPAAGYFMTHTRLYELGVGGLLGVWAAGRRGPGRHASLISAGQEVAARWSRTLLAAAGLAAVGISGCLYSSRLPFPGAAALVPVLGAAAVIAAGEGVDDDGAAPAHALMHPLSHPWLQYVGDISYSLYLAHWPVVVVYPFATGRAVGDGAFADWVTVLAISWALAHACKRGWEDRFRCAGGGGDGGGGRAGPKPGAAGGALTSESMSPLSSKASTVSSLRFVAVMTAAGLAASVCLAWLGLRTTSLAGRVSDSGQMLNTNMLDSAVNIAGATPTESPVPPALDPGPESIATMKNASTAAHGLHLDAPYIGAEAWARDAPALSAPLPVLPLSEVRPPLALARMDRGPAYTVQGKENCIARVPVTKVMECPAGRTSASDASTPHIVLIGDSHAAHWLPALAALADARGWRATGLTKSSCLPTNVTTVFKATGFPAGRPYTECLAWADNVFGWLMDNKPDVAILSASPRHSLPGQSVEDSAPDLAAGMADWVDKAVRAGIKVAAIKHTPFTKINVPLCLSDAAAASSGGKAPKAPNATAPTTLKACTSMAANVLTDDGVLSRLAHQRPDVHLLDFGDAFCGADGTCPPVIGNVVVHRDAHHMTATYARSLAPALDRRLAVAVPSLFGHGG